MYAHPLITAKNQKNVVAQSFWHGIHLDQWGRPLIDVEPEEFDELTAKYGTPAKHHFRADFLEFECSLVRRSRDKGRAHDVTCFIRQPDGRFVCIQKHQYARSGIYRAPSGGAKLGERIEDAAFREMKEETGLDIRLQRFVLDLTLEAVCKHEVIPWRSFVFLAEAVGGTMTPIDTYEIFEVKVMDRETLLGPIADLMRNSGWGGFAYRSFLTQKFFECLDEIDP